MRLREGRSRGKGYKRRSNKRRGWNNRVMRIIKRIIKNKDTTPPPSYSYTTKSPVSSKSAQAHTTSPVPTNKIL